MRMHKTSTSDKYVPSIHTGADVRMLNLLIISKSQKTWPNATDRGIQFRFRVFHVLQCGIRRGQYLAVFVYMGHRSNFISRRSGNQSGDFRFIMVGRLTNDNN